MHSKTVLKGLKIKKDHTISGEQDVECHDGAEFYCRDIKQDVFVNR